MRSAHLAVLFCVAVVLLAGVDAAERRRDRRGNTAGRRRDADADAIGKPCNGRAGLCIDTQTMQCPTTVAVGICPGSARIRCCPDITTLPAANAAAAGASPAGAAPAPAGAPPAADPAAGAPPAAPAQADANAGAAPAPAAPPAPGGAAPANGGPVQSPILWIGDSHTAGPFGAEAYKVLSQRHPETFQYGRSGWKTTNYLDGGATNPKPLGGSNRFPANAYGQPFRPTAKDGDAKVKLSDLLNANPKPKTCIAALGANEIGSAAGALTVANAFRAAGCRCIWIGPPRTSERGSFYKVAVLDKFYEDLQAKIGSLCTILRSRNPGAVFEPAFPNPNLGDGLHYSAKELMPIGTEWGKKMAEAILALT